MIFGVHLNQDLRRLLDVNSLNYGSIYITDIVPHSLTSMLARLAIIAYMSQSGEKYGTDYIYM